ncbi:MAG: ATP-binding protein [Chromatiaceae bacterium]
MGSKLLELIAKGEHSSCEFERDDIRAEQLAKHGVALANRQGGRVLLGVEDDGTPTGIQRPNLEEWVMDTVFGQYVHPMILPFYEEVQIEPGLHVAVVSVTQGTAKPYVVRHKSRPFASKALLHWRALSVMSASRSSLAQLAP